MVVGGGVPLLLEELITILLLGTRPGWFWSETGLRSSTWINERNLKALLGWAGRIGAGLSTSSSELDRDAATEVLTLIEYWLLIPLAGTLLCLQPERRWLWTVVVGVAWNWVEHKGPVPANPDEGTAAGTTVGTAAVDVRGAETNLEGVTAAETAAVGVRGINWFLEGLHLSAY